MKISVISDVHVHPTRGNGEVILKAFCENKDVINSDYVIFLGDIFDLLVFNFDEYIDIYKNSIESINELSEKGPKVFFVEGNHDFSFYKFFNKYFNHLNIRYEKEGLELRDSNKVISFLHGDSVEVENTSYKIYRKIIRSSFLKSFYDGLVSFNFVWDIGERLLEKSFQRHLKYNKAQYKDKTREKFRSSARQFFKNSSSDILVCGHSHVKDLYRFNQKLYLNNGFAQSEKTFLFIDNLEPEFINLKLD